MSQARNPDKAGASGGLRGIPPAGPGLRDPPPRLALGEVSGGSVVDSGGLAQSSGGGGSHSPGPPSSLYGCVSLGSHSWDIGGRRETCGRRGGGQGRGRRISSLPTFGRGAEVHRPPSVHPPSLAQREVARRAAARGTGRREIPRRRLGPISTRITGSWGVRWR